MQSGAAATGAESGLDARRIYTRIAWRLIPYMFVLYIAAYIDRVNVGFAAMDMQRQLHFSNTVYGTGAGIFFLGYALCDLPSSLLLRRFGTRVWIARIMISWGVVSACMVWIHSPGSFYALRLLLGVAEAGFVPGMLLYLTLWFPSHERARAVAAFMTATSLAGVVGAPLSSALLKLDGVHGLSGWQWLFLCEGIPTVLLGVSVLFVLQDSPQRAAWLTTAEKQWLHGEMEHDRTRYGAAQHERLQDAFRLPAVWLLAGVYIVIQIGVYIVNLWMPLILSEVSKNMGSEAGSGAANAVLIARYATLPYLLAAVFTVILGRSSDRWNERRWHLAGCMALAAAGCVWAARAGSIAAALCALSLLAIGLWSTMGPFWALMTRMVSGSGATGAVAIITTVGGLGGFLGPYLTGLARDATHSFAGGLLALGVLCCGAAALALCAPGGSNASRVARESPGASV